MLFALALACSDQQLHTLAAGSGGEGPQILVEPEVLDFGTLDADDEPVLQTFHITSVGTEGLALQSVQLREGDYASFELLTFVEPQALAPGESLSVDVLFHPWGNEQEARAVVHSNDEDTPAWPVDLFGSAEVPELDVDPDPLDHGTIGVGCERENVATITSVGAAPVTLSALEVTGTSFELLSAPTLPLTLEPGETTEVEIGFYPTVVYDFEGALVVTSDEAMGVREALQLGAGTVDGSYTDDWYIPEGDPPSDILFSVDASCSMNDDLWDLAQNFETFINELDNYTSDWQVMIGSTDDGCNTGGILKPSTPNYVKTFQDNILWGGFFADWTEALLTINVNAIENTDAGECNAGFLRSDALLHIIDVTDEPEQSVEMGGLPWDENVQKLWDKKGSAAHVRISAIAGPVPGGCDSADPATGYAEAVNATGGVFLSICDDWASDANLALLAAASVNQSTFELSHPAVESTIVVKVNGSERSDWTFDAGRNVVIFDDDFPAGGDKVVIHYDGVESCD